MGFAFSLLLLLWILRVGFKTESYYITQAGLEHVVIWLQLPKNWDGRHIPPFLVRGGGRTSPSPLLPVWILPTMQPAQLTLAPRGENANNMVHPALQPLLSRVLALRADESRQEGSAGGCLSPTLTIYTH